MVDSGVNICVRRKTNRKEAEVEQVTWSRACGVWWPTGPPATCDCDFFPPSFAIKSFGMCSLPGINMEMGADPTCLVLHCLESLLGQIESDWWGTLPFCCSLLASPPLPLSNQTFPTFLFLFTYRVWFVASIWLWIVIPLTGCLFFWAAFLGVI